MIKELIDEGKTRQEIVEIYMEIFDLPREDAEFIYAIETGEVDSDVVEINKDDDA